MSAIGTLLLQCGSRIVPFALFLAAWQGVAKSGLIDPTFLPSVGAVASALIDLGASKSFYAELAVTFGRSLGGLALGAAHRHSNRRSNGGVALGSRAFSARW